MIIIQCCFISINPACAFTFHFQHSFGDRSFSEAQESWNLLGGASLPSSLLKALIGNVTLPSNELGIVNLSAFEGALEYFASQYHRTDRSLKMVTMSCSLVNDHPEYSQRCLALHFLSVSLLN